MRRLFTVFVIGLALSQTAQANANKANSNIGSRNAAGKRDTTLVPAVEPVKRNVYSNSLVQRRLDSVQIEVPLVYNEFVQSYIDLYTAPGRRSDIGRIMGLTKYYFPIYEKAFREAGIPEEIKFLSIVESALDPKAVSRVGATGPWQFMYATGKLYGLNVDGYVDERCDPIQASYAAAAYLKDAYQEFGDWLLAIASYNCGKSSVERAIDKSGGATDFWSIRPYLPKETRGYVPAFIAMTYVMNYHNRHGITPQACSFTTKTDTLMVDRAISLSAVSKVLNVEPRHVFTLNPSYLRGIVHGSKNTNRRLIVPQVSSDKFAALYALLNDEKAPSTYQATPAPVLAQAAVKTAPPMPTFHKVRRGETLADIADEFGVEVAELKTWNKLRGSKVPTGTRLRLTEPPVQEDTEAVVKSAKKFVTYKVRKGDTLFDIAEKFEASVDRIKELNGIKKEKLQPGMTLKIDKV